MVFFTLRLQPFIKMSFNTIGLFRFGSGITPLHELAQEVVYYGKSRFRLVLVAYNQVDLSKRGWIMRDMHMELVRRQRLCWCLPI